MDASQKVDRQVVAYASRVLTKTERQYCATRREMLALVWAVQHSCGAVHFWSGETV